MQFVYPWFLVGLLAVGAPIVIHLLQLRRPQRLLFTNTSFIREFELVTKRQRNLKNLAILLLRVLAIAALVLAFGQPFIRAADDKESLGANSVGVVVDNSFSMQQPSVAQKSLLEEAVVQAGRLGELGSGGEQLQLLNTGSELNRVGNYQEKLNALKLSVQPSLLSINSSIGRRGADAKSVYLFSDFQKNEFSAAQAEQLGKRRAIILAPVVGTGSGNAYVDSVWLDDAFVRVRINVGLRIRLRNGGTLPLKNCPVKVFLGAQQVAAFRVAVEPRQAVTSVVQLQLNDGALALGRVVTEDNPVRFDNTFYFTMQPAKAIRVLEVGPEPVAQRLYANEPLFTYSFAKPQQVDYNAMRQASLVVVHEVSELEAGMRNALRAVVARGGSVVVVPAAAVAGHSSYEQLFWELGLGAVQWEAKSAAPELREVAMPSPQEPFFRNVFGVQQRGVTMPRAAPVLRWSRTGTDILRLKDGESYLAEFTSGPGKVYVFSAPFTAGYSDFTRHALFVPVLYRMAMLSYRDEQLPAYRLTQGTVALRLPSETKAAESADRNEASFRFVKDSVTLIPAQRVLGQDVRLEVPVGMNAPGFYQVQRRGQLLTTVAFNQDKRESELAAYSAAELRQLIGPNRPNIRVLEGDADGVALAKFQAGRTEQPLWRYCLAVALACLLAEALLLRYGNRPPEVNRAA
ncbi:BatA domain-containing protein [Hymenobacter sp.]|uniref:BatA domain-containing protein n=1 Tax=Hymenobacter sp. TaxID=1898978 RepID=UPI00286C1F0E|nr:BatA domain-containing protein [Hymenobacter sp.]